jgi:hypothetical protein
MGPKNLKGATAHWFTLIGSNPVRVAFFRSFDILLEKLAFSPPRPHQGYPRDHEGS